MKNSFSKIVLGSILIGSLFSCNKTETTESYGEANSVDQTSSAVLSDSISSVADLQVKDKQFIKSAEVTMDVKDVYDTTIYLEKSLKELGGFVTSSNLNSHIMSEETFNTSNESAMLVRKFQTENNMEVRIPTEKLGAFLQIINDKKLFLNSRIILAEDVTANIKLAKLEANRNEKTGKNISQLKTDKDKVNLIDNNESENNDQKIANFNMADQLKYSAVQITLKEPKLRIAEIAVTNVKNIDNKYKNNFFYEVKNAIAEGFYLIQKIAIGLVAIWPLLVLGGLLFYFLRKKKRLQNFERPTEK